MMTLRGARALAFARAVLFSTLLVALWPQDLAAQARPAPTAEQLEAFRNLPPDQQRAVLDAMSGDKGGTSQRPDAPLATPQIGTPTDPAEPPVDMGPPRIDGPVTLVLEVKAKETDDPVLAATLKSRQDRILAANPYVLDNEGGLILPFLPRIRLRGLTAEEAEQRLNADPRLTGLELSVKLLRIEPVGADALKPFGYDVFRESPTTFAPATDIPVPPDYAMGPGDTVRLELFGKRSGGHSLVVDREGRIHVPDIGPVQAAGLSFDELRADIQRRIESETIGVRASVTMGPLRSIRIFVAGDVAKPGSYTVSGLSTVTHALFTSGGVSEVGSLRNVEVKRRGVTVGRFDLYALLLRGDGANDVRLQSGDVVFVHPVGSTAAVAGRVRRPAIYEVLSAATVGDLLDLAGGLAPDADSGMAKLERIDADRQRVVLDVDLKSAAGRALKLQSGDVLNVPRVLDDLTRIVTLEGYVERPGRYAWRDGMRLTDLLGSLQALKLNADQRYILIRREHMPGRRLEVLSADAAKAFETRGTDADPLLRSRDRIIVLEMRKDRGDSLSALLEEVRLQTRDNRPVGIVTVTGRVRAPGQYPLETGMRVSDLVRAGGGLDEAAYGLTAELARLEVNGESRTTTVTDLKLSDVLAGSAAADVVLRPYDTLVIKETPEWSEQGTVRILGEVRFPGDYPVRKGETLSSVIRRAGGLTEHAFVEGSVFTREEIKDQERQQLETLANRLQSDLALVALQGAQTADSARQSPSEALAVGQSLLSQLRNTKPVGRLVIDLDRALTVANSDEDVQLRNGDSLTVPALRQYVAVLGEVQNPTSHVWRRGLDRDEYLDLSGGLTDKADDDRIYIVRANGSVEARARSGRWFSNNNFEMRPGDSVVVPLDTQKMRPLPLWSAVTTIIYNLAVSVAAIGSL
jgi:polysaccharide biosynthesis/export protein